MHRYEWLQQEQRQKRRGIADVIEVLLRYGAFHHVLATQIRVDALRLPSQEIVGLVAVFAESAAEETTFILTLPTSKQFRAARQGSPKVEEFDIFRLDGATVDSGGAVTLADGTRLRAVEVIPSLLPYHVTELDWCIVHHAIESLGAESECHRYPISFERPRDALDCSALPGLQDRIPLLKQIHGHMADREPQLEKLSKQQIANTLRKFGMRISRARPRRPPGRPPGS